MIETLLPERLKLLRKEKELTQDELGLELGVSKASISKYEKGLTVPSFNILLKMAEFFEVSIDYLIGKSNSFRSDSKESDLIGELAELFNQLDPKQKESLLKLLKQIKKNELAADLHKIFEHLDEEQSQKMLRLFIFLKNDFIL